VNRKSNKATGSSTNKAEYLKQADPLYWDSIAGRRIAHVFASRDIRGNYTNKYAKYLYNSEERKAKLFYKYLKVDSSILDVGCGAGEFYFLLPSNYKGEYTGIDFSSEMIRRFRARLAEKRSSKVALIQTEFLAFDPIKQFDFVLGIGAFQFMSDLDIILYKCRRTMSLGGYLIFDFWNSNHLIDRLGLKKKHPQNWALMEVKELLIKNGFEIIRLQSYENRTGLFTIFTSLSTKVDYFLQDISIFSNYFVVNHFGRRITIIAKVII
jgi:SAM-dependent methyltransferase